MLTPFNRIFERTNRKLLVLFGIGLALVIAVVAFFVVQERLAANQEAARQQKLHAEHLDASKKLMSNARECLVNSGYNSSAGLGSYDALTTVFEESMPTVNLWDYHENIEDKGIGCVLRAVDAPSVVADAMWANRNNSGTYFETWDNWTIEWSMQARGSMRVLLKVIP